MAYLVCTVNANTIDWNVTFTIELKRTYTEAEAGAFEVVQRASLIGCWLEQCRFAWENHNKTDQTQHTLDFVRPLVQLSATLCTRSGERNIYSLWILVANRDLLDKNKYNAYIVDTKHFLRTWKYIFFSISSYSTTY